ncbi:MAG: hypothetical protein K1X95_09175 [Acidimicrobiia bacterium]|nr:hypothetical protein [Acidimicrobiia bacterium]
MTTLPPDPFVRHPKVDRRRGEPFENPAGLKVPAQAQFHGTALVILVLCAALVAVVAPFVIRTDHATVSSEVVDSFNDGGHVKAIVKVVNTTGDAVTVSCNVRATDSTNAVIGEAVVKTRELQPGDAELLTAEFASDARPSQVQRVCNPAS